jgi:hypothetical protein
MLLKHQRNSLVKVTWSRDNSWGRNKKPSSIGSVPDKHKRFFSSPKHANRILNPNSLPLIGFGLKLPELETEKNNVLTTIKMY